MPVQYPDEQDARYAIIEIGKRMYARGFTAANDGNISIRTGKNEVWTTPAGVSKGFMTADMPVKVDLEGRVMAGERKPSSELRMHLRIYQTDPALQSVVHAHPPIATAFAVAGYPLDEALLTESVMGLGVIPLAPYATPGTEAVPDSIAPYINSYNGVLLANHGALAWGRDLFEAWYRMEAIEHCAAIALHVRSLRPDCPRLCRDRVAALLDIRRKNGITTGGIPLCAEDSP